MQKIASIVCWIGALVAFGWAGFFLWGCWKDVFRGDWEDILYVLALLGMIALGIYLSIVAIRSVYLGKGTQPSQRILFVRKVAVASVYVLSSVPQLMLVLACPTSVVIGITCCVGEPVKGLIYVALGIVSALIPFAIFRICRIAVGM